MDKQKLLEELKEKFRRLKKQTGFKSKFEEINTISFIEDMILSTGFVSEQFSRQLINRMVETHFSWIPQLHSWLMPSPYDLANSNESKKLSDKEKQEIKELISRIIYFVRKNKRIGIEKNSQNPIKEEGEFIDEIVEFDKKEFSPLIIKLHKKFEKAWKENLNENEKQNTLKT